MTTGDGTHGRYERLKYLLVREFAENRKVGGIAGRVSGNFVNSDDVQVSSIARICPILFWIIFSLNPCTFSLAGGLFPLCTKGSIPIPKIFHCCTLVLLLGRS